MCFQLSGIGTQVLRLVEMYGGWLITSISDEHDTAKPQSSLEIHIGIAQVRTKVHCVRGRNLVHVHSSAGRRASEACCGRTC